MMLIILDKNPAKAVDLLPKKIRFKQLLELAQMISTITRSVYKPIKQGKAIREWIVKNDFYVKLYYLRLYQWCEYNINMSEKTKNDLMEIYFSFTTYKKNYKIKSAIFRYNKNYKTKYLTDSELPINMAINEYKKYVNWKGWK